MKPIEPKLVATAVLFLLTLASGVWLTHAGRPLNTVLLTLHKLIALATVVVTAALIHQWRAVPGMGPLAIGGIAVTGLLYLSLFITGALLSLGKPMPGAVGVVHDVLPLLAAASTAGTLYLLVGGRLPA